jgi:hypothetical protein
MKRITISLPDHLAGALHREARRRRVPASEVSRLALAEYLSLAEPDPRRTLPFASLGGSGQNSTARDMEQQLEAEWRGHPGRS